MRKLLFVFIALFFVISTAVAEDIGFTLGLEVGVANVTTVDDANIEPYLKPSIIFDNSFFDGKLDLYAELAYTVGIYDDNPMYLYAYAEATYNLFFGEKLYPEFEDYRYTLSFILGNEIDSFMISPWDDGPNMFSILKPGIKFTQASCLNYQRIGDLYLQVFVPVVYLQHDKNADTEVFLEATAGWDSRFGLLFEITPYFSLVPDFEYVALGLFASYDAGLVYAEVDVTIPNKIDEFGITVTPEVSFNIFNGFEAYLRCIVAGIGADWDMVLTPGLGVRYSF